VIRTQVQLTEEQARQLRRLAAERGVSVAQLIRESVEALLERSAVSRDQELRRRAKPPQQRERCCPRTP
jgi:16S rRNA U516 pseudouridylate synthase RsuA-like enzyme